jgi:hypothetical protein
MIKVALLVALLAVPAPVLAQGGVQRADGGHTTPAGHHHGGRHHADGAAPPSGSPTKTGSGAHASDDASLVQSGQSAFAAIQEIVGRLVADPRTDWTRVDVEALRRHLIDMDNVTLRARVSAAATTGGTRFEATSRDPDVARSIRSMLTAHAGTTDGTDGWSMRAEDIPDGAALTVVGGDQVRVRALGLIGLLVTGMHHQAHHLAIATGTNPHVH